MEGWESGDYLEKLQRVGARVGLRVAEHSSRECVAHARAIARRQCLMHRPKFPLLQHFRASASDKAQARRQGVSHLHSRLNSWALGWNLGSMR